MARQEIRIQIGIGSLGIPLSDREVTALQDANQHETPEFCLRATLDPVPGMRQGLRLWPGEGQ